MLLATRADPLLSPDSMTYLAAADHLRSGQGLTDFTGEPLTVFPPVFPVLLSPGGRDLAWASTVTALAVAVSALLLFMLLRHRVRPWVAAGAAAGFATAQGTVRVGSTVWSEMPYVAVSLGAMVVLSRRGALTRPWLVLGGALAGLGFLTRYAGLGLVLTGGTVVLAACGPGWAARLRAAGTYAVGAAAVAAPWLFRNLLRTGEPLGPRFEGGTTDSWATLWWRPLPAVGELLTWPDRGGVGVAAVALLGTAAVLAVALVRGGLARRVHRADIAVAAFAVTSYVVPVLARAATSNDIEYRVMSPMLVPVVYAAALVVDSIARRRPAAIVAAGALAVWAGYGVSMAAGRPDDLPASAAYRAQFAPALYDVIDRLPADAEILTNSPQRVWWHTGREPVHFAFTRPRAGNSHYPLDLEATLRLACTGRAHLAWFDGLANAGDGPEERRPDLLAHVELRAVTEVPGGTLYQVVPRPGSCEDG